MRPTACWAAALIQSGKVSLFGSRQLSVGAVILIIGIGGAMFEGGNLPIQMPGLSAVSSSRRKRRRRTHISPSSASIERVGKGAQRPADSSSF